MHYIGIAVLAGIALVCGWAIIRIFENGSDYRSAFWLGLLILGCVKGLSMLLKDIKRGDHYR